MADFIHQDIWGWKTGAVLKKKIIEIKEHRFNEEKGNFVRQRVDGERLKEGQKAEKAVEWSLRDFRSRGKGGEGKKLATGG